VSECVCVALSDYSCTLKTQTSRTLISALLSSQPKQNNQSLIVLTPYSNNATEDQIETIEQVDIDVGTIELIVIDALDEKETSQSFKMSDYGCGRYRLTFPAGKSPYSAYPFRLHDVCPLLWKSTLVEDTRIIFSRGCTGQSHVRGGQCRGLAHVPLIPAGFRSFLRIPVPFQWNLPAKFLKFCYSGIYTGTVPRMAPECSDQNGH
jgi:hypothetical protein